MTIKPIHIFCFKCTKQDSSPLHSSFVNPNTLFFSFLSYQKKFIETNFNKLFYKAIPISISEVLTIIFNHIPFHFYFTNAPRVKLLYLFVYSFINSISFTKSDSILTFKRLSLIILVIAFLFSGNSLRKALRRILVSIK